MPHPRRFEHEEARKRHADGESIAALARSYGVSHTGMWRVVSKRAPTLFAKHQERYYARRTVPCETCGEPTLSLEIAGKRQHNPDGRTLCRRCRSDEKTERLRYGAHGIVVAVRCNMIACANGERWQPLGNFTNGTQFRHVRDGGISSTCRACQTSARREYRRVHAEQQRAYDREYQRRRRSAA